MSFDSHGELKIWVQDNIVYLEASGGWNLEKAREFTRTINEVIFPQLVPPFGVVGVLHNDWMPTADAIPHLHEATRIAIKAGMVKEAYVSSSAISSRVTQSFVLPPDCSHYQSREFSNLEEAVTWIKEDEVNNSYSQKGMYSNT